MISEWMIMILLINMTIKILKIRIWKEKMFLKILFPRTINNLNNKKQIIFSKINKHLWMEVWRCVRKILLILKIECISEINNKYLKKCKKYL